MFCPTVPYNGCMDKRGIAERAVVARYKNGMTLAAASRACSLPERTIRRIETGETMPQAPTLTRLAAGYGVQVTWLLLGDDDE